MKKRTLHTTVYNSEYQKLLVHGKGRINKGITNILQLIETRQITISIVTEISI
jgi:hypothetical protein